MPKRAGSTTGRYVVMNHGKPIAAYPHYSTANMRTWWERYGEVLTIQWFPRREAEALDYERDTPEQLHTHEEVAR